MWKANINLYDGYAINYSDFFPELKMSFSIGYGRSQVSKWDERQLPHLGVNLSAWKPAVDLDSYFGTWWNDRQREFPKVRIRMALKGGFGYHDDSCVMRHRTSLLRAYYDAPQHGRGTNKTSTFYYRVATLPALLGMESFHPLFKHAHGRLLSTVLVGCCTACSTEIHCWVWNFGQCNFFLVFYLLAR